MDPSPSLRSRIAGAFDDQEVRTLCFDRFPAVYREFTTGMTSGQMIDLLLDYCVRHQAGAALLDALEQERPGLVGIGLGVLSTESHELTLERRYTEGIYSHRVRHQQRGECVLNTIRSVVLTRHAELVREQFAADPTGEAAFAYALELYLWLIPNLDTALDGWGTLRLVHETPTSLRAVGIMYVLPASEVPVEVELSSEAASIRYRLRIGIDDDRWKSLSDSKRWKAVYLYARGERDEQWNWSQPLTGLLADA